MMRLRLLLTTVVLLCAGQSYAEAKRIDFWHSMSAAKGKLVEDLVQMFNALPENQGRVKVVTTFVGGYEDGINKLRTAMVGKRGPHLAQIYEIGTQVMMDSRAIVPLQDFIDKDPDFPAAKLMPQILRYYSVDGRLYALPFASSNPILYYNMELFERAGISAAPKTFSELTALCPKLTNRDARITAITWPLNAWFFEQFVAKQGQVYAEPDNGRGSRAKHLAYASPAGVNFLTLWRDLVKSGCFANAGRGWDPAEQNFLAGRSVMFVTSTSDVMEIQNKAKFRVGTAPIFGPDHQEAPGGTVIGGNGVWVMRGHPDAEQHLAYEFLRFMTRPESQRFWHTGTGYFPIRSDVIDALRKEGFYKLKPAALTAIDQLLSVPPVPATNGALLGVFPEAREHIESAVEQVLAGRFSPEEALRLAALRTDKSLARYNSVIERIEAATKK